MIYRDIINEVLRRLREDQMTDWSGNLSSANGPTDYHKMVGDFVNDAKYEVEHYWDWQVLRVTSAISTSDGVMSYSLLGAGRDFKVLDVIDTSTGTSASASSWTVGAGTISLSGGTGGAIGKATTAVTAANANGTDGTITVNTSGYANDTSYNGVPNVYEDVTNFLATGVTDYITAGGEGSFGGSAIAVSTSEGPGYAIWTDPAGVAAGIRIVYDAG